MIITSDIQRMLGIDPVREGWCELNWSGSVVELLRLDRIPARMRLKIAIQGGFIPDPVAAQFAAQCAECALLMTDDPDPRSLAAVEAAADVAAGNDPENLQAIGDAAMAAFNEQLAEHDSFMVAHGMNELRQNPARLDEKIALARRSHLAFVMVAALQAPQRALEDTSRGMIAARGTAFDPQRIALEYDEYMAQIGDLLTLLDEEEAYRARDLDCDQPKRINVS